MRPATASVCGSGLSRALPVRGEGVDRRVVDARLDPALVQRRSDRGAIRAVRQDDDGQVVRGNAPWPLLERHHEPTLPVERLAVAGDDASSRRVLSGQQLQLLRPDGCPHLVEPVVEPREDDVVVGRMPALAVPRERRHSVRPEQPKLLGEAIIVRDEHAALSDRQVLVREEAETPDVAEGAAHAATEARPGRVRRVLDDRQPPRAGERPHRVHVARVARVVERDDRLRAVAERRLDVGWIEIRLIRSENVAEDGLGSRVHDRVRGGDEVQRRDDHLVSRAAPDGQEAEVERRRPVGHRDGVRRSAERGELALELLDSRAHAPPAGAEGLQRSAGEVLVDHDVRERHLPAARLVHRALNRKGGFTRQSTSCPADATCVPTTCVFLVEST